MDFNAYGYVPPQTRNTSGGHAAPRTQMPMNRLNGAARKRFKWLMSNGFDRDTASRLAQEPLTGELGDRYIADASKLLDNDIDTLGGVAKERYSMLMNNGGYTKKEAFLVATKSLNDSAPKRNASDESGPQSKFSKAGTSEGITMAVTCTDYPVTKFTDAQTSQLKSDILKQVVQQKDVHLNEFVVGYLSIRCSDQKTCEWLQDAVARLELWEGASLQVVSESELFKSDIYAGYFSDSEGETNTDILEYIQSQNDGLDTSKWNIISRKEIKSRKAIELMFTVDEASAKSFEAMRYELNYKFVEVKLHKHRGSPSTMNHRNMSGQNRYGGGNPNHYDHHRNNWNSEAGNPFNLVDTLLTQLNIMNGGGGSFGPNPGGNFNYNQYGGPRRRGGGRGYNSGGNRSRRYY